jgi:large subunit ribosomal protein L3
MSKILIAKKVNMSGRYTPDGRRVGVTVLEVFPMSVNSLRTKGQHGYSAVRYKITDTRYKDKSIYREERTDETPEVGSVIELGSVLSSGDVVKISGITKGHGFAGAVKRHGFRGGPRSHGQSDRERAPGSSGSGTTPGRVYKGKRRAGHMGVQKVTLSGLKVLEVSPENRQVVVIGSIPGSKSSVVTISKL